ncbi:hypothetical protein BDD12DRAFT_806495 [Trichophaea hybrida]|nr:hypothetical protein BDD12DRAFT_806495 [Trichophaea hybrida]
MIPPVRTDPVWGRDQSGPVQPEGRTGPSPRLAVWDWTGLVWTSPNRATPQKQMKFKVRGPTEGNIRIDDPQQKQFISYLLVELLPIELRHIIKLQIIGKDGTQG